ncbi:MAG: type II toxin-antitoxin system RelE/ParE family toxin [Mucilaginibacter sp.]|uniref:type II toxin-antitoxin system RelE/ParE family toxin n=1 Tax=Mucilaginibacter sp. TaxID=1882438 RepID=UPI0034E41E05
MNFEVIAIPRFRRDLKKLSKKYVSLKTEYAELISVLEHEPEQGVPIGNNCFKIRLAIASKSKGKLGGARVIICVRVSETTVYLLTIYDKNEKENISNSELLDLLKEIE